MLKEVAACRPGHDFAAAGMRSRLGDLIAGRSASLRLPRADLARLCTIELQSNTNAAVIVVTDQPDPECFQSQAQPLEIACRQRRYARLKGGDGFSRDPSFVGQIVTLDLRQDTASVALSGCYGHFFIQEVSIANDSVRRHRHMRLRFNLASLGNPSTQDTR